MVYAFDNLTFSPILNRMRITVESFGVDTPHDPDLVMDRPEGISTYLLCSFSTPFVSRQKGAPYHGKPGDCFLSCPGMPHYFASVPGAQQGFRGEWIHLDGPPIQDWITRYSLPTDRYISTGQPLIFRQILKDLQQELHHRPPLWQAWSKQLVETMFLALGRAHRQVEGQKHLTPSERHYQPLFLELREEMHTNLARPWRVETMAARLNLSVSRFSVLWKCFFPLPPGEDLLEARLDLAKHFLLTTAAPVAKVAEDCGFASLYHFSRIFKRRIGCAPSAYARR